MTNNAANKEYKRTLADVRAANKAIGNHWFERETMKFFDTRIESSLLANHWFITSEQFDKVSARLYSIRFADADGGINTVGCFQGYRTKAEAKAVARDLIREFKARPKSFRYQIRVYNDPKWYDNAVRFATKAEAESAGLAKFTAWTMAEAYQVAESDDIPNCRWADGAMEAI